MTDIDALCRRLMGVEPSSETHGTVTTNWYRNPDGPEAAALIREQAATIARLRQERGE